jgi:hypothetical protein
MLKMEPIFTVPEKVVAAELADVPALELADVPVLVLVPVLELLLHAESEPAAASRSAAHPAPTATALWCLLT